MMTLKTTQCATVDATASSAAAETNKRRSFSKQRMFRRILLSPVLVSFLSFSLVGCCSSEALVTSSLLPRSLFAMRGGSEKGTTKQGGGSSSSATTPGLTCVLQVPRGSALKGAGRSNGDHTPHESSGVKGVGNPPAGGASNGVSPAATDAIPFTPQRKNGLHKVKKNGASMNIKNKKGDDTDCIDVPIPAQFVAETNLPTDVGQFRLRAYRTAETNNGYTGNEPCVIYPAGRPPFGNNSEEFEQNVPVRIHDQCLTSEVFRSQRYVLLHHPRLSLDLLVWDEHVSLFPL